MVAAAILNLEAVLPIEDRLANLVHKFVGCEQRKYDYKRFERPTIAEYLGRAGSSVRSNHKLWYFYIRSKPVCSMLHLLLVIFAEIV
jgi:hypothetical protein